MARGALENIKVLDLTRILAGPLCTMMLADMGADVVKIEIPEKGDDTRGFGPFKNGESLYYANINRNKKGITLNLKKPEGKKMFLEMVKKADIVVENFRPGIMDKLGLGYEKLAEVNNQVIYGAVSGFGCYGPYKDRPGYDIIAQAMGGLMSITGNPGDEPLRVGNAMGDILGGLSVTIGILAAINARHINGKGQRVDVSLVDSVVASLEICPQRYFASGELPEKMGNRYSSAYPYDTFLAKDGYFVIGCGNQKLYENLINNVIRKPEMLIDERFLTNNLRCINHAPLKELIEEWAKDYTIDEVVDLIMAAGVPAATIYDMKRVTEDEHIANIREMFIPIKHPIIGDMKVNGCHVKLFDTKLEVRKPAPLLGQDNEAVYKEFLNLNSEELKELKAKGII